MMRNGSNGTQKKLVIKPFKTQPKLPESYEEETWAKLKAAISAVNNKTAIALSKEELYHVRNSFC
jgi:cullin-4